jgi:hypothetical protein
MQSLMKMAMKECHLSSQAFQGPPLLNLLEPSRLERWIVAMNLIELSVGRLWFELEYHICLVSIPLDQDPPLPKSRPLLAAHT